MQRANTIMRLLSRNIYIQVIFMSVFHYGVILLSNVKCQQAYYLKGHISFQLLLTTYISTYNKLAQIKSRYNKFR